MCSVQGASVSGVLHAWDQSADGCRPSCGRAQAPHTAAQKAGRQSHLRHQQIHDPPRQPLPGAHTAVPVATGRLPGGQHWAGLLGAKACMYMMSAHPVALGRPCTSHQSRYCTKHPDGPRGQRSTVSHYLPYTGHKSSTKQDTHTHRALPGDARCVPGRLLPRPPCVAHRRTGTHTHHWRPQRQHNTHLLRVRTGTTAAAHNMQGPLFCSSATKQLPLQTRMQTHTLTHTSRACQVSAMPGPRSATTI
jgi:hypothetical protein